MVSEARKICFELLCRIESGLAHSDDALHGGSADRLAGRDRNLATEVVYGTLRWQGSLDYLLAKASARPWEQVSQEAKALLRMSLYQLWHMDRVPDHAVLYDAVELAKQRIGKGSERFVNAVLRNLARRRPWQDPGKLAGASAWQRLSVPEWLWKRWSGRYGEAAATEYALSLNRPPRTAFRYSGGLPEGTVASDLVPGACIRCEPASGPLPLYAQDEASQLIAHLLGPIAGARVWDACAAPGGKAAILSACCGESGRVLASDRSLERAKSLARLLKECGCRNAAVFVADAGRSAPLRGPVDASSADVPCSGLGTLRRNPEIKWRFRPEQFPRLQSRQLAILEHVSQSVRPGGRLLYSTCSTEPEENEFVVEQFLRENSGFRLQTPEFPAGIRDWTGPDGFVRTFPGSRIWDGFFAALLVRVAQGPLDGRQVILAQPLSGQAP